MSCRETQGRERKDKDSHAYGHTNNSEPKHLLEQDMERKDAPFF